MQVYSQWLHLEDCECAHFVSFANKTILNFEIVFQILYTVYFVLSTKDFSLAMQTFGLEDKWLCWSVLVLTLRGSGLMLSQQNLVYYILLNVSST